MPPEELTIDNLAGRWIPDIPNDTYHRSRALKFFLSSSNIKRGIRSMAHYMASIRNPEPDDTPAKNFGSAFHSIALGYPEEVVVSPVFKGTGSVAARAEFKQQNHDKYIITEAEKASIQRMCEELTHHKYARSIMESPTIQTELSGFFRDHVHGLPCKIRPDLIDHDLAVIADLKSTLNAEKQSFVREIYKGDRWYHVSGAWYRYGGQLIQGHDYEFVFIAVEKQEPYAVHTELMAGRGIELGWNWIEDVLPKFKWAFDNNKWRSYPQTLTGHDVPGYALNFKG